MGMSVVAQPASNSATAAAAVSLNSVATNLEEAIGMMVSRAAKHDRNGWIAAEE
ncbi:MAG: hypothetical protein ABI294_03280 [Casimicrobiaceae bacterium]